MLSIIALCSAIIGCSSISYQLQQRWCSGLKIHPMTTHALCCLTLGLIALICMPALTHLLQFPGVIQLLSQLGLGYLCGSCLIAYEIKLIQARPMRYKEKSAQISNNSKRETKQLNLTSLLSIAITEELLYRGFLLVLCRQQTGFLLIMFTSCLQIVLFALSHLHRSKAQFFSKLALGTLATMTTTLTSQLYMAISMHCALNTYSYYCQLKQSFREPHHDRYL